MKIKVKGFPKCLWNVNAPHVIAKTLLPLVHYAGYTVYYTITHVGLHWEKIDMLQL